ncbi:UNVERIFIED_CONTAM: hypothetical protein BEN50_25660 [Euhalothece sp. KZN 001]
MQPLDPRQTRAVLVGIAAVVVVLSMVVGFFIGHNAQLVTDRFTIIGGMVTVPVTPQHMAAYGGVISLGVLSLLYLLLSVASGVDPQAKR